MRSLQIVPILRRFLSGFVTELPVLGYWAYFVDNKGQRMLSIRRFVVMYRAECSVTYAALASHCLKTCSVFPSQATVSLPGVLSHLRPPPVSLTSPVFLRERQRDGIDQAAPCTIDEVKISRSLTLLFYHTKSGHKRTAFTFCRVFLQLRSSRLCASCGWF